MCCYMVYEHTPIVYNCCYTNIFRYASIVQRITKKMFLKLCFDDFSFRQMEAYDLY